MYWVLFLWEPIWLSQQFLLQSPSLHCPPTHCWFLAPYSHSFFLPFLCCAGRNLGTAWIFFSANYSYSFFPSVVVFLLLPTTFLLLPTVCGLPSAWLASLALFHQPSFIKIWSACLSRILYNQEKIAVPFLTVLFNHSDSSPSVWPLCSDLLLVHLLFLSLFPSYLWNFLLLLSTSKMRSLGAAVISSPILNYCFHLY